MSTKSGKDQFEDNGYLEFDPEDLEEMQTNPTIIGLSKGLHPSSLYRKFSNFFESSMID